MTTKILAFDLATTGLQPFDDRIVGITCKSDSDEIIFAHKDEKMLLKWFWEYIEREQFDALVGFNSDEFDIPMLVIRSIKHGVPVSDIIKRSVDLRKALCGEGHRRGRLCEFGDLMGMSFPNRPYRKKDMFKLWLAPPPPELKEFLLRDAHITYRLFQRAREVKVV